MSIVALCLMLAGLSLMNACAQTANSVVTDAKGCITALYYEGEHLELQTNVRIPVKGWRRLPSFYDAQDVKMTRGEKSTTWTGRIEVEPGKNYRYEEIIGYENNQVSLDLRVTAEADVEIEGVFFWLDVPISVFSGGICELDGNNTAVLPVEKPANRHFLRGNSRSLVMTDIRGETKLALVFDRALPVVVQDTREWQGSVYSAFCQLAPSLAAGQTTGVQVRLSVTGQPDTTPANLTLDANQVRYHLHGFGGNYCFGIESPITQYTLANLRQGWARTEMTAYEWEPENDNADPAETNWEYFRRQDAEGSNLRREFLLAKQIQDQGIPYVISIWGLPGWLYDQPVSRPRGERRKVPPEKWDEMLECVGSYLLYAKEQYGVEPDLFSFNEANIGVDVLFTAEEHREAIKAFGAHFAKLGLKTKMLLADATGPRGTHTYAEPAAADPEAMQYVGAVGFHSWGGANPEEYAAWGDLAERLGLPLLVTELGVDAGAWRTRAFDSFHYALREVQMYQEILLYARPQGTQQWEFTSDYGICTVEKNEAGEETIVPTVRYHFVSHFCNLTPLGAEALSTSSDNSKVLFTAFRGEVQGQTVYTLHLANLGPARTVTVSGLPPEIGELRVIRTSETEVAAELVPAKPANGRLETELSALSLTTLTTYPAG
ncbi:MAG: hypothetical protein ACUVX8_03750 [Candidatus Zipacnadales bacterium]